jgi:PKD repeat protein
MRYQPRLGTILLTLVAVAALAVTAIAVDPLPLPAPRHIFVNVANDAGVKWDWDGALYGDGNNDTYYIKADGGGLNELHITNDLNVATGQITTTPDLSGVLYITNTGGRGFDNDIILLVSVKGPVPDDFGLHVRSSGYNWTPATPGAYTPLPPTDYYHVDGAVDETFTKADFIYGPQTWKPSAGDLTVPSQPLFFGQSIADTSSAEYLMFIDLYAGNMYPSKFGGAILVDNGAVKVEYAFTNLTSRAEFNGYGWCSAANQNQGISWTNPNTGITASGYSVVPVSAPGVVQVPTGSGLPTDSGSDGLYEDVNGNRRADFADVVLYFNQMSWIAANEPLSAFDYNANGRIDFADVVRLFNSL